MYKYCFLACFYGRQRAQRLTAELTIAQIRVQLPNGWTDWHQIWHTCADSSGNGYTPNNLGSHLWIHLGMDIGKIQFASQYPMVISGGFRGSQIQKYGEAAKQLDRLAQIWHTCRLICEWIYAKQPWFTFVDSSGNGHRLNTIRPPPQYPMGISGGFRGSQIQKYGEAVKRLDRLAQNLAHMQVHLGIHICRFIWEWT